jgi:hypothetical protein
MRARNSRIGIQIQTTSITHPTNQMDHVTQSNTVTFQVNGLQFTPL